MTATLYREHFVTVRGRAHILECSDINGGGTGICYRLEHNR